MKNSATVSWIHLSDIHATPGAPHSQQSVLDKLPDAIRICANDAGIQPDFLFVTGDLTDHGNPAGFGTAWKLLRQIAENHGIGPENIFVVPGNHDVKAQDVELLARKIFEHPEAKTLASDIEAVSLKHLEDFFASVTREGAPAAATGSDGRRRLPYAASRVPDGVPIGIIGVNSAVLSYIPGIGGAQKGHVLSASLHQIERGLGSLKGTDGSFPPIIFVLTHYPPDWAPDIEPEFVDRALAPATFFLLHGHVHKTWYTEGGIWHRIVAGASLNGGEAMGEGSSFNLGQIDLEACRLKLWFYEYRHDLWSPLYHGALSPTGGMIEKPLPSLPVNVAVPLLNREFTNTVREMHAYAALFRESLADDMDRSSRLVAELRQILVDANVTEEPDLRAFADKVSEEIAVYARRAVGERSEPEIIVEIAREALRSILNDGHSVNGKTASKL